MLALQKPLLPTLPCFNLEDTLFLLPIPPVPRFVCLYHNQEFDTEAITEIVRIEAF